MTEKPENPHLEEERIKYQEKLAALEKIKWHGHDENDNIAWEAHPRMPKNPDATGYLEIPSFLRRMVK